jgi:Protein of unknown function (DUF3024)
MWFTSSRPFLAQFITTGNTYHRDSAVWTETPIAQFRFDRNTQKWSLFSLDRNDRWHLYDLIKPSMNFDDMLKAIDNDKTGAFWG